MVYSIYGILGTEAVAAQRHLASLLSNNLEQEYLNICGFLRAQISLAIVRSNTLLLRGSRNKEAYICQRLDLIYGALVALLDLWRG